MNALRPKKKKKEKVRQKKKEEFTLYKHIGKQPGKLYSQS
jgi:hypothetical protein